MSRQRWQDWAIALIGLWVFFTPWIIPYFFPASAAVGIVGLNYYVVGLAIAAMGVAALTASRLWEEWVDVVLGVWLLASPLVLGFTEMTALTWNAVIAGAFVVILSAWALLMGSGTVRTA